MKIAEFTARIRDDASRFRVDYERALSQHPTLYEPEQEMESWLKLFVLWLEADLRGSSR